MAKATKISKPEYELLLTGDEAQALLAVCEFVAGDPVKTPRRHMDAIRRALNEAGAHHVIGQISGRVLFES